MDVTIAENFRYKIAGKADFSSAEVGAIFIECNHLAKNDEQRSPLQIRDYEPLIWIVESPTDEAVMQLQKMMPNVQQVGRSLAGYFEPTEEQINKFWSIHFALDKKEPWNYETPWAMACLTEELPKPDGMWEVGFLLEHWTKVIGLFVQAGWFGFIGLKKTAFTDMNCGKVFPKL